MKFIPLLGKRLKDDEIIEILESLDLEVIYDFDRLHEGQSDIYWASSKPKGIQFRFDGTQCLDTAFLYVSPGDGFEVASQQDCDIPFFASKQEVETFGEAQHLRVAKGSVDFLGTRRDWVRIEFSSHSVHYQFEAGRLALVTISRTSERAA
jgi:hypothetical protein